MTMDIQTLTIFWGTNQAVFVKETKRVSEPSDLDASVTLLLSSLSSYCTSLRLSFLMEVLSANLGDPKFSFWHTWNFQESNSLQSNFEVSVKKHDCDKINIKRSQCDL